MEKMYTVIIADDHAMFTDGLKSILANEADIQIKLTASDGQQVINFLRSHNSDIDLVITDINMPDMNGVALNGLIKDEFPHIKTLVVSMLEDAQKIKTLTDSKVNGYISKNSEKHELLTAIRTILKGSNYFSERIKEAMMKAMFEAKNAPEIILTEREKEVIKLIAKEYTTQEIADTLFLSKHTIESYRKSLISKLQVRNLAGLTRYALENGLVD
ncbi:response regulator transcription factor [Fulvivirga maritima]|uniref:response regulator transcription factor n=1 Tax=Fulvivirga maritima TaxID=2904247 RepID=UPI001F289D8B|nr:response regulator transcription factor [Fulvivirga maritima]UII27051.1 response regulator transcription factor [Fulvivirga maritima]